MTTGHAAWDELAAGYAVNALEPEDEQAFLDHLRGCDPCRDTLAELEQVTGQLGYAAEPAEPPADLGRRILDAAAAERPAVFGTAPPPAPAAGRPRAPRRSRLPLATLATAAAALGLLSLGIWNFALRGGSRAQELALGRRDKALACLAAPEAPRFTMTAASGARATSCLAGGRAFLVADRLDRNDRSSSIYVLWWTDADDGVHPVAGFDIGAAAPAVYELPLGVPPADVRSMVVSLEPGREIPAQPTRQVVAGEAAAG